MARKLHNLSVSWISLVDRGANKRKVIWKAQDTGEFLKEVKISKIDNEKRIVYGIVYSPNDVDTQGDYADAETIEKAAHEFLKNNRVHYIDKQHNLEKQDAYVAESWIVRKNDELFPDDENGWAVGVKIEDDGLWEEVKKGELASFSLFGTAEVEEDKEKSLFQKFTKWFRTQKGAVPVHHVEEVDDSPSWDGDAAVMSLRKWASSDGSGDKDKIDWNKYKLGFAWFDSAAPEEFTSYKLPHHVVRDGKFMLSRRGLFAAMQRFPNTDLTGDSAVYQHFAAHYRDIDEEPPKFRKSEVVEKVGAVLSAANFERLQNAVNTIQEVLNLATKNKEKKENKESEMTKEEIQQLIKEELKLFEEEKLKKVEKETQKEDDPKNEIQEVVEKLQGRIVKLEESLKKSQAIPPDQKESKDLGIL